MLRYQILFLLRLLQSITIAKLWNICKLRISFYASVWFNVHRTHMPPAFVSIEPTNICNLHCPECPTGNKSSIVPKGYLDMALLQRVIPQIQKYCMFVNVYFQGEPFLHDSLPAIVQSLSSQGMITSLSTNAHFLTKKNAEDIVQSKLTKIIISLDGYNQESYEIYRKNGSFLQVINGLDNLVAAKRKFASNYPLIELQCLLFSHTVANKNEIRNIGKQHGVDVVVFKTAQFYSEENLYMLPHEQHSRYIVENGSLQIKSSMRNACWRMWSSVVISWQGNVLPCCFDKNHTYAYGNLNHNSLHTILNSKQIDAFKKNVHCSRKTIPMCKNCTS